MRAAIACAIIVICHIAFDFLRFYYILFLDRFVDLHLNVFVNDGDSKAFIKDLF